MALLVISYSRIDQPLVRGLVSLLRAGLRGIDRAVYWDEDFEPGDPWFDQMRTHIDEAQQLFVVWCAHSAESKQVAREVDYAINMQRRVVPVLVDESPLPPHLAPIHGINLREVVLHQQIEKSIERVGAIDPWHGTNDEPLARVFTEFTGFEQRLGFTYHDYIPLFDAFIGAFPTGMLTRRTEIG